MDYIELGLTPADEDCAQVGSDDYYPRMRKEAKAYIAQLRRTFGDGQFTIKAFPHDFGSYHEVCISYAISDTDEMRFAFNVERNLPSAWDDEARKELGL